MRTAVKSASPIFKAFLFGAMRVERDGKNCALPASVVARSLFGYLLHHHTQPHTRSSLLGLFWSEMSEERARRALSQALWNIRHSFPGVLDVNSETVCISHETAPWVDAETFERMVKQTLDAAPRDQTARQDLEQAIELYRADFLEGFYHEWTLLERERLSELFLQALEQLGQLEKTAGHYAKAIELALRLSRAEPLNEAAHREVMRLHHLLGQSEAALRQFELCRQTLQQEMDLPPEPETLALAEEIGQRTDKSPAVVTSTKEKGGLVPTPLVGRETDRAALLHFVDGIFNKLGGLILLEGEAGVGKTRLIQEIAREAEWRGAQVLWGNARESPGYKPYAPLVEALQSGLTPLRVTQIQHVVEKVWLQTIATLLAPHPALPVFEPAPPLQPAQEQARLVDAIIHFLKGWATVTPTVILLEDLHWADQDTLALLPSLVRGLSSCGILMICSYRGEDVRTHPRIWEALQTLSRSSLLERRVLSRLDESDTGELIRRSLDLASPAPLFESRLFRETDGNPLFVLETLRALQDEGLLHRDEGGRWITPWDETTTDYAEMPLPTLVEKVITRRLRQLPSEARRLLELMAVLGTRFDFVLLDEVSGLGTHLLLEWTRELIQRAFLEETSTGYQFGHEKIHRMVYDAMKMRDCIRFHHRIATHLRETRPTEIGALANHTWEAQEWDQAANYHQLAGEQAAKVYAITEAMKHYDRALEAIQKLPGSPDLRQIYSIRLARQKIYDLQGERDAQTLELDALAGIAENLDDDRYRAEVALCRARQADLTCDFPLSIKAASQAVNLARAAKDPIIEIEGYLEWGWCLLLQGKHDAARSRFEQVVSLTRSNGLNRQEADGLHGVGTVGLVTGNYLEAKNYFHQVLDICRQVDIRPREGSTFANLGYIATAQGDHKASKDYNEQALRIHRETGDQRGTALVMQNLSDEYQAEGDFSTAKNYLEQALDIQETIQARDNVGVTLRGLGVLYHRLGDYKRATDYYEQAQAIFIEIGIPYYQGQTLAYMSLLSHHLDENQAAWEKSQRGLEIARKINDRLGQGLLLDFLGHALTGLGRLEQAVDAYRNALALHQELNESHLAAESHAGLARLALLQGNLTAAEEQVEEILRIQKGVGIGGVNEPFRVYLTCYRVLDASHDPRALGILRTAYELLMTQKANIKDARLERSFLEVVTAHREIVAIFTQHQGKKVIVHLPKIGAPTGRALHADEWVDALWTPSIPEDDAISNKVARRHHRLSRLIREAGEQGCIPIQERLAEALGVGLRTIERDLAEMKKGGLFQ